MQIRDSGSTWHLSVVIHPISLGLYIHKDGVSLKWSVSTCCRVQYHIVTFIKRMESAVFIELLGPLKREAEKMNKRKRKKGMRRRWRTTKCTSLYSLPEDLTCSAPLAWPAAPVHQDSSSPSQPGRPLALTVLHHVKKSLGWAPGCLSTRDPGPCREGTRGTRAVEEPRWSSLSLGCH